MRSFKFVLITFAFFLKSISVWAGLVWSTQPIEYKRYLEVQTHLMEQPSHLGFPSSLGYYLTTVIDFRFEGRASVLHSSYASVEADARINHQSAMDWLIGREAHLRIEPDMVLDRNGVIEIPSAPRSGRRPTVSFEEALREQQALAPVIEDEEETKTTQDQGTQMTPRETEDEGTQSSSQRKKRKFRPHLIITQDILDVTDSDLSPFLMRDSSQGSSMISSPASFSGGL